MSASLLPRIVDRIQRDFFRAQYALSARQILNTNPIVKGALPFSLLSMVQHRDLISYLVAVKSFVRFVNPKRIVVVCDPSINTNDKALLKAHIPHVEFRHAEEFWHPKIPKGGTWERLRAITAYAKNDYIIQLDSDTVTISSIPEVEKAIQNQRGFVLGETAKQQIMTLDVTSKRSSHPHVQAFCEQVIDNIGLHNEKLYVRGCSGFTGFPPNVNLEDEMLDFSERMAQVTGERWKEWGTEQVTSNFLVANLKETSILPFPKYGTPDQATLETVFFHFTGSIRFLNGIYTKYSRDVITSLQCSLKAVSR